MYDCEGKIRKWEWIDKKECDDWREMDETVRVDE